MPDDHLTAWAINYLSTAKEKSLSTMLQAALDRRYSGNTSEGFATAGGLQSFANFCLQFVEGSGVADIFREFVVEFRESLRLDAQHIDGVVKRFARELGIGVVRRINHVKILVIAGVRSAQILVERRHGLFRAYMA